MREHVVRDRLDVVGPQERAAFGRHALADVLASHVVALRRVIGAARKIWHAGSGAAAGDGLDDVLTVELGLAQRQRITAIAAAAIAVPFVAADAVGAFEHRLASVGRIRRSG